MTQTEDAFCIPDDPKRKKASARERTQISSAHSGGPAVRRGQRQGAVGSSRRARGEEPPALPGGSTALRGSAARWGEAERGQRGEAEGAQRGEVERVRWGEAGLR